MQMPTFHHERELLGRGYTAIVGVDEVGAGALAGPVLAAAVILPLNSRLSLVRDSKKLSALQRDRLYGAILAKSPGFGIGTASPAEIHAINIRNASHLAMKRAIDAVPQADFALVDAWTLKDLALEQRAIIRGDQSVKSIAAASIIAKVTRDRMMQELAEEFPQYGFEVHKGYGTKVHREALKAHGPCEHHRMGFRGVLTCS